MRLERIKPEEAKKYFENKITFLTGPVDLSKVLKEKIDVQVVDVRAAKDYVEGHIPGAVSLPEREWSTCRGVEKNKINIFYCYSPGCFLAARAAAYFAGRGYQVMEMDGGMREWLAHHLAVTKNLATTETKATPQQDEEIMLEESTYF